MKHTPGPWDIRYKSGIDYLIRSEGGMIVEGKFPMGDSETMNENEVEWHSNAKLIAAAPDLLYALKAVYPLMTGDRFPEKVFDQVIEAIKKATE